jgi:hypothetical protein
MTSVPFVKLARSIESHDLWLSEPFTRGQAWVDLILKANHRDGSIFVRGVMVPVLRGQVGMSEVKLAERWGWSRGKVKRFLKQLEAMGQIVQQTDNRTSIITLLNYEKFQARTSAKGAASGTADEQQTIQQTDSRRYTNKKDKNLRREEVREEDTPDGVSVNGDTVDEQLPLLGGPPPCPHQKIIDLYHEVLPELRRVRVWNGQREKYLRARWKEDPKRQDLDWWKGLFEYVRKSPFLMGLVDSNNGRAPFQADLEWLVRPSNFNKVIEGKYAA